MSLPARIINAILWRAKNAFLSTAGPLPFDAHDTLEMDDARAPLDGVLVELLECDPRASFVIELPPDLSPESSPSTSVAFANLALTADTGLYDAIVDTITTRDGRFWQWIVGQGAEASTTAANPVNTFSYMDCFWTRSVFRKTFVIVGCNEQRRPSTLQRPAIRDREKSHTLLLPEPEPTVDTLTVPDDDFTVPSLTPESEEPFGVTVNNFDWASTPLGSMLQWPASLQQTFNQILADSRPIALYWGPKLTILYNEAFGKLCGVKHPGLLGKSVEDAWPDFCDKIKQTMQKSTAKLRASVDEEWRFFIEKADGSLEETYLKWSIVPIMPEHDNNVGFLQPVLDTTSMRLWERRMQMLIDLGDALVAARDAKSYWRKTIEALEACDPSYDVPLVVLYSVEHSTEASEEPSTTCNLEGSLGVPKGHPLIPQSLALDKSDTGLSTVFREAIRAKVPTILSLKDGTLPEHLLQDIHWRGFEDPCHEAIIVPIRPTKDERVMGLLVLGLNPRRPYDNDYQQYILLLSQKLTTTLACTILLEEEARRGRNIAEQAAYDRAKLKEKLAVQTKEANEWVSKFQAIAELIPVGMCFGNIQGEITFANDAWHLITGVPKTDRITHDTFMSRVVEDDRQNVSRAYSEMRETGSVTLEFRVRKDDEEPPMQLPIGSSPSFEKASLDLVSEAPRVRHISAALKAETAPDGTILRVLACMTDVTLHKRAADEAIRRAQLAENMKKMADSASVGMYEMQADGRLIWANNVFLEMCGLEKKLDLTHKEIKPFQTCVVDEDLPLIHQALEKLTTNKGKKSSTEIRLNTAWSEEDGTGNTIVAPRCMLAMFRPVKTTYGRIETFTGCLVDMTLQRHNLETERKRKDEAIESKRQQENFIDMTSHEMRNPLSAIVQCADSVVASCSKVQDLLSSPGDAAEGNISDVLQLMQNCIDNAETIDICAQHQRHIVDDILTMSKMDSDLLAVSPTTVDPKLVAKESLKMFEVEARRVDINLSMTVDPNYHNLRTEFLDLDPSRLRQVLINLLTNALKFTKTQATRNVSITLSASEHRPTDATSSVQYIPQTLEGHAAVAAVSHTSSDAEVVYLIFEVKDTGQGLTEEEKSSLFQRFVQASPKTHVKYGGSGLGLFISKRLTEMLGGQIGVASRPGHGSTFAFYVAAAVPGEEALQEARATAKTAEPAVSTPTSASLERLPFGEVSSALAAAPSDNLVKGVLIVEDNLINQQITRRGLLDKGYKIEVANHGVEALEKLKQTNRMDGEFPLGVVMMDMEMPTMDGLTCTRNIREMENDGQIKGPRIPIIAVSANARSEQIQEAKAAGCDDVLVKPYKIPELIKVMQKVAKRLSVEEQTKTEEDKPEP
ncbi:hypothetical protein JX266_002882 [Neoarthrinium moseri]|uniref:uncharacterized protein n=1 Tax=Neoarthrinium moseri TaxID=1658444 RepID=UPI001FDD24AE|nr:uncharacterized protein JN550_004863 [Neoarthrinium moseri]KAI1852029.1 hypothetical protein JX266_002882 [Neoarthrinium moseri]KAI1870717.1 hypothetical protein JN550_004863 [Neoarthrinium moseri]